MAARLLYKKLAPDLDALSPQAPLLFLNGPLTGTAGPAVGRFVITARSPATNLWGESNCDGFWGPVLRMAGLDGLLVTGKAIEPVYIWIQGGGGREPQVEIRPATRLWGLDTYQTQSEILAELDQSNVRVAVIGPAGEALIPFALVLTDHGRVAGRTGMGAVMGSKNLKAIAVKGHGDVPVFHRSAFSDMRSQMNRDLRSNAQSVVLREMGTASAAEYFDYLGVMPKRYFQKRYFEGTTAVSGANIHESILVGVSACHACVVACGRAVQLEALESVGVKRKGPEYETLVGFGPNLMILDPIVITRMGELCDRYGMDSISLNNTIGLAFTLYEMGLISTRDSDGIALEWGDAVVVESLIHLAARRQGFGASLAEGARALARRFGAEDKAVQVNNLEVAYHDPRGASGMGLVYATSPRGACHNQSDYFLVEVGGAETVLGLEHYPRQAGAEKAANVARRQDWRTVCNSLVLCTLPSIPPEQVPALDNSACDLNLILEGMMRSGERGWNLKRVINHRLGLSRASDRLPKALLNQYSDG